MEKKRVYKASQDDDIIIYINISMEKIDIKEKGKRKK